MDSKPAVNDSGASKMRSFSLWSFLRNVLEQGAAINQDNMAGKFPTYEHWSARMDEAARERADQLETHMLDAGMLRRTSSQLGDTCEVCGGKWVRAPEGLGIMHNCPGFRPETAP